ncbi:MAG: histidine phosphatase family protein, partial [Anaerolineales bacterium]
GGQAVSSLLRLEPGRILVVSHGGILNMALYAILGIAPQAYLRGARFIFENTAFAEMSYLTSEDIWLVEALNECNHWQQTK